MQTTPAIATRDLTDLLVDTQLDFLQVSSVALNLCFYRGLSTTLLDKDLPVTVWVALTCPLTVGRTPPLAGFAAQRAVAIAQLYRLIGQTVTAAEVQPDLSLHFQLDGQSVLASPDSEPWEHIWAVMSETPDVYRNPRWCVSLEDKDVLTSRRPG